MRRMAPENGLCDVRYSNTTAAVVAVCLKQPKWSCIVVGKDQRIARRRLILLVHKNVSRVQLETKILDE